MKIALFAAILASLAPTFATASSTRGETILKKVSDWNRIDRKVQRDVEKDINRCYDDADNKDDFIRCLRRKFDNDYDSPRELTDSQKRHIIDESKGYYDDHNDTRNGSTRSRPGVKNNHDDDHDDHDDDDDDHNRRSSRKSRNDNDDHNDDRRRNDHRKDNDDHDDDDHDDDDHDHRHNDKRSYPDKKEEDGKHGADDGKDSSPSKKEEDKKTGDGKKDDAKPEDKPDAESKKPEPAGSGRKGMLRH